VLHFESGAPLRGAFVLLDSGGDPARAGVITDDSGQYVITGVTAGRHTIHVSKVGYVTSSFSRRSSKMNREVVVADRQTLNGIDFALAVGGVIVARVTDEQGDPSSGVTVDALMVGPAGLTHATFGVTNDLGVIRLYGLMAGEYVVRAGEDRLGPTPPEQRVHVSSYFPGTPFLSQAQRVVVGAGQETSVAFPRVKGASSRIRGTVRGTDGIALPFQVPLMLRPSGIGQARQVGGPPDAFEVTNIRPGEYILEGYPSAELSVGERRYFRLPLTIAGQDLLDLVVTATTGGTLRGRIVSDSGAPLTGVTPDAIARQLSAMWAPVGTLGPGSTWSPALAGPAPSDPQAGAGTFSVNTDWTFEARGIMDPRVLRLREPAGGWSLKSVTLGDRDITDLPIDYSDGRIVSDVQVVLTRAHSQISGSVSANVPGSIVVVFPDDRRQWTAASRSIAAAPTSRDGSFMLAGFPAGRYLAAAISGLAPGEERDQSVLEAIRPFATPVVLQEAESVQIALRIIR
jgi:hypothetical protein